MTQTPKEGGSGAVPPPLDAVRGQLEQLGLSGNEARLVLALLRVGAATPPQLARLSGVPRTSVYPILEALASKRLAEVVPGEASLWASPGRDEVLGRLFAAQQDRLRDLEVTVEQARTALSVFPKAPSVSLPYVHVISDPAQTRRTYDELLSKARSEVLVFNKAPYLWAPGQLNAAVMEAMGRGVAARAMYEEDAIEAPEAAGFRREHEAYMAAGVKARVVDTLPIKLAVFDRRVALLAMTDPVYPEGGYPTALLVEHPGYAAAHVATFDHYWESGRPYQRSDRGLSDAADSKSTVVGRFKRSRHVAEQDA